MSADSPHVLVIDDDAALVRMIRLSLESEGYAVTTAPDGLNGLEELAQKNPDVIVLDLQMPRMDGRSFFTEIRSRGYQTPVLILSAYGAERARMELNANAAVNKPFDPEVLTSAVERLTATSVDGASRPA